MYIVKKYTLGIYILISTIEFNYSKTHTVFSISFLLSKNFNYSAIGEIFFRCSSYDFKDISVSFGK